MRYIIGDKVVIKKDLIKDRGYGGYSLSEAMSYFKGKTVTIKRVDTYDYVMEDAGMYWTDEMIDHEATEKLHNKNKENDIYMKAISNIPNTIHKVTFNEPATIILWDDKTKTIVKTSENDTYDPIYGFLYAYFEKTSGMTKTQCGKFFAKLEEENRKQHEEREIKKYKKIKEKEKKQEIELDIVDNVIDVEPSCEITTETLIE